MKGKHSQKPPRKNGAVKKNVNSGIRILSLGKRLTLKDLCKKMGATLVKAERPDGTHSCRLDSSIAIRRKEIPEHGIQFYAHSGEGDSPKEARKNFVKNLRGKIIWKERHANVAWLVPKGLRSK